MAPSSSFSSSSSSSSSSSPSVYPSSYSSLHSPPSLHTNLTSSSWSSSYRSPTFAAHDQLETLIARHGHPTRVSLSSLEELTATSSTYNPPSPFGPVSPVSETPDRSLSRSVSRPIPIPKRSSVSYDPDIPVTPLTGRFDKGYYFAHRDELAPSSRDIPRPGTRSSRRPRRSRPLTSRMRSDNTTFYAPVVSPSMSPTNTRPASPQPSRSRPQSSAKSLPAFHLGSLPRFHPAVYPSSSTSQNISSAQPPSPRQPRQALYRTTSGSRDTTMWHYRDLMEGVTLPKAPSRPLSPGPSAPRLDPLRSPGPVTPLTLEEASGYLVTGASQPGDQQSGPAPDLIERLIARENERLRQQAKKITKTR